MKKKKISALSLNKKTVSELNGSIANRIMGGNCATHDYQSCVTVRGGGGGSGQCFPPTGTVACTTSSYASCGSLGGTCC